MACRLSFDERARIEAMNAAGVAVAETARRPAASGMSGRLAGAGHAAANIKQLSTSEVANSLKFVTTSAFGLRHRLTGFKRCGRVASPLDSPCGVEQSGSSSGS